MPKPYLTKLSIRERTFKVCIFTPAIIFSKRVTAIFQYIFLFFHLRNQFTKNWVELSKTSLLKLNSDTIGSQSYDIKDLFLLSSLQVNEVIVHYSFQNDKNLNLFNFFWCVLFTLEMKHWMPPNIKILEGRSSLTNQIF